MKEKHNQKSKAVNLGLEILRLFLCLWIVIIHCSKLKNVHKKYLNKAFHVPTFFVISFYFYFRIISKRVIQKIILRFQRLLIPYIIWPIIIFSVNHIMFLLFNVRIISYNIKLKDIYIQILIGSRYHGIFWFQFNLIIISLFFTIISLIFKTNFVNVCFIIFALSISCHISGIIYRFFYSYNPAFSISVGTIIEMVPLAISGLILGSKKLLDQAQKFTFIFYCLNIFFIYNLFEYKIFADNPGFRYPNVLLNIFASFFLFITFGSLSFKKIENTKFFLIINSICKYTGGIYYLHPRVSEILKKISKNFNDNLKLKKLKLY